MVKFHEEDEASTPMAFTTTPSSTTAPSRSTVSFPRKQRPFKRDHPHHFHPAQTYSDPFSGVNLIHVHNVQNPPVHYFIHHHHCPFPPPQCAEMCSGGLANGRNGGATSKCVDGSTNQQPAKFYFGPGFEPQRSGAYDPGRAVQGREREQYIVNFHVNPGVNVNLMMRDGSVEVLRGKNRFVLYILHTLCVFLVFEMRDLEKCGHLPRKLTLLLKSNKSYNPSTQNMFFNNFFENV